MLVDKIIQKVQSHIEKLEQRRKTEHDSDKKFLLGALRNILRHALANLSIFYCKELQDVQQLNYKTKRGSTISIPLDRTFLDRSLRRLLILDIWGQLEFYYSKKVPGSDKMLASGIVQSYYQQKGASVPDEVTFIRETRNCLHGNGIYSPSKSRIDATIDSTQYSLLPGQEVDFVDYQFILSTINTTLNLL